MGIAHQESATWTALQYQRQFLNWKHEGPNALCKTMAEARKKKKSAMMEFCTVQGPASYFLFLWTSAKLYVGKVGCLLYILLFSVNDGVFLVYL